MSSGHIIIMRCLSFSFIKDWTDTQFIVQNIFIHKTSLATLIFFKKINSMCFLISNDLKLLALVSRKINLGLWSLACFCGMERYVIWILNLNLEAQGKSCVLHAYMLVLVPKKPDIYTMLNRSSLLDFRIIKVWVRCISDKFFPGLG